MSTDKPIPRAIKGRTVHASMTLGQTPPRAFAGQPIDDDALYEMTKQQFPQAMKRLAE